MKYFIKYHIGNIEYSNYLTIPLGSNETIFDRLVYRYVELDDGTCVRQENVITYKLVEG